MKDGNAFLFLLEDESGAFDFLCDDGLLGKSGGQFNVTIVLA